MIQKLNYYKRYNGCKLCTILMVIDCFKTEGYDYIMICIL